MAEGIIDFHLIVSKAKKKLDTNRSKKVVIPEKPPGCKDTNNTVLAITPAKTPNFLQNIGCKNPRKSISSTPGAIVMPINCNVNSR
jgi:hypothetical protein